MIDIVLATYNGERFLAEQIESIQNNLKYTDVVARFIIVDDGSTDKTESIVKSCASQDSKIEWHLNSSNKHGPSNNFAFGMSLTTADHIMLCDQDDIWLPEKITTSLLHLQSLAQSLPNNPLLVFSDKLIVSDSLELINNSYFSLKNIPLSWHENFAQLCQQNVASGCTMLFNRKLLEQALPIPENAYMHDWWLVLVASYCGKVELIEQPLIRYRQHDSNSIGANKVSKWSLLTSFSKHLANFEQSFLQTVEQSKVFNVFLVKHGLPENKTITALSTVEQCSKSERLKLFLDKTITRSNFIGKVALLIVLLKMKVESPKC